jgi:hypothetical protein
VNGRPHRPDRDRSLPEHPFRDSALVNAGLSAALLGVAWVTGGELLRAVVVAIAFFLVATGWNWWRFRQKLAEQAVRDRRPPE